MSREFEQYFQVVPATTEELRDEVYKIRYAVYCEELHFENPAVFPDGREIDSYDYRSQHCLLLHKPTNTFAGCVRLIHSDPNNPTAPFPGEVACNGHLEPGILSSFNVNRQRVGEISRLAVLSCFRRRKGEQDVPVGDVEEPTSNDRNRRHFPLIALGLYLSGAALGLLSGLDSVFVMMEPRLARRLRINGIEFRQVGDLIDYHGRRGPYQMTKEDLLNHIPLDILHLLNSIKDELELTEAQKSLAS